MQEVPAHRLGQILDERRIEALIHARRPERARPTLHREVPIKPATREQRSAPKERTRDP